jgi:2-octaprenyl-6-methoxyphenol hydroxylase
LSQNNLNCDVLIVGGGLVGSTLAYALAQTKISTVLLEERNPSFLEQPSFDDRVTALANGSQRILQGLGLWADLAEVVEPIKSIHISERGRFGVSRIMAEEEGVSALGYTIENRVLGSTIWSQLSELDSLTCLAPAKLDSVSIGTDEVIAGVQIDGSHQEVRAKLVVAADGIKSKVRESLGITALTDVYHQQAVIVNCQTEVPHDGQAFERFTSSGPLAFLPLRRGRVGVVWTLDPEQARIISDLADEEFVAELQKAFGNRLGRIGRVGSRSFYPLTRVRSDTLTSNRAVLVGNAALSLHPVAGQGFNLALRDIAALAEVLTAARYANATMDLGDSSLLGRYQAWRLGDQRRVAKFTHGLVKLFGYKLGPLAITRGLCLMAFDLIPGAKGKLAQQTMGLTGRLSRLARGLPLVS